MGSRSSTETIVSILKAFLDRRTWTQADLARHVGVSTPAVQKRLRELQESGIPLHAERDHPHMYWSVPKDWYPGGVLLSGQQIKQVVRQLSRVPKSKTRDQLLEEMAYEEVAGGIRVTVETSALERLARYVVGLGDATKPLTPELEQAAAALARGVLASIARRAS